MNLFFRTFSIAIAALLAVHIIGCESFKEEEERPAVVFVSATPPDSIDEPDPKPQLTKSPFKVTDKNFTKLVMESELPVVVYFWADWCPPCKWMAPIIKEVASEYKETFLIAKLDADSNRQTVQKYRIEALPTFVVFKNGKMRGRFVGGMQKADLVERIRQAINAQGN